MLALFQHNTLAYYAFCYAGIFDAGLNQTKGLWFEKSYKTSHAELLQNDNNPKDSCDWCAQ